MKPIKESGQARIYLTFSYQEWFEKGDALSSLFFNFALGYGIRCVRVNKDDLKLNGTYQLLVYADNINILVGSIYTITKNTEALVVVNKETGLEVNADKTKYMVKSGDQNAGLSHNIKIDNSPFERVEEFKYLGTHLMIKILFRMKLRAV